MKTNLIDEIINIPHEGPVEYTAKDFKNDLDVRWCPGCGNYSILAQLQKVLADLGVPREDFAIISGIGCSSRFPYYMNLYGIHGIHGRALPIASGLKIARPDLSVWVATGDGDNMSIGGNHFIHACRRNIDLNVCMFNNEIYSLTKGQYSPTSRVGQKTKSSPYGVIDDPFDPILLALGAGAPFVARVSDKDVALLREIMKQGYRHKGFSFLEVYSNCVIFNDGSFNIFTNKEIKDENTLYLEHEKPLVFGKNSEFGIKLDGFTPVLIDFNDGISSVSDALVYNNKDKVLANIVASMVYDMDLPRPVGVFLDLERPSYEFKVLEQIRYEREKKGVGTIEELLKGDNYWVID